MKDGVWNKLPRTFAEPSAAWAWWGWDASAKAVIRRRELSCMRLLGNDIN